MIAFDWRAATILGSSRLVLRNEELPSAASAKELNPYEDGCHNYGVNSIYCNGVDRVEIRQRSTIGTAEGNIRPKSFTAPPDSIPRMT